MESFDGGWLFPFYSPLKWEALLWVNQLMKHTIFVLSRKLTARPWKSILVQMTFPFKEAYFLRLCYKVADLCAPVVVCTRLLCRAALNWLRLAGTSTQCLSRTKRNILGNLPLLYCIQFMYVFTYIDLWIYQHVFIYVYNNYLYIFSYCIYTCNTCFLIHAYSI